MYRPILIWNAIAAATVSILFNLIQFDCLLISVSVYAMLFGGFIVQFGDFVIRVGDVYLMQ